jgi:voltage-gated potassium channel
VSPNYRFFVIAGLISILCLVGTAGYMLIEGWNLRDALFMTVITLSTVGYGEVQPLSAYGEIFTLSLILLGVGVFAYTISTLVNYLMAGELRGILRRQRMERTISRLHGHYIICGYGRVGRQVAVGLLGGKRKIVVIDQDANHLADLEGTSIDYIAGDATNDRVLRQAGIERASGICTCLPSDAENVFTVLTARMLNPKLNIISRTNSPDNEYKFRVAGANHVINPYTIAGRHMAAQLTHPTIIGFLDAIIQSEDFELRIEEVQISADSPLQGKTLAAGHVRDKIGVSILAVRNASGLITMNPGASYRLQAGDTLFCLGSAEQLQALIHWDGA